MIFGAVYLLLQIMLRFLATVAAVAAVSASDFNEKVRQCRSAPYMFSIDIVGKTTHCFRSWKGVGDGERLLRRSFGDD